MIKFSKAFLDNKEYKAVKRVLKSGWLTTGAETRKFEEEFAEYVGADYAVAVSSCTVGLEMAIRRLDLNPDSPIIVPSFTFCATSQAVENCGHRVVFGDIDRLTYCLNPDSIKDALEYAQAVIPVHLGGCKAFTKYDVPVIEDSAHRIEKDQCKNSKNMVVFSFYPTKNMTTGEGGMICTNSKADYEWLIQCRSHGRTKLAGSGYDVEFCGLKANLPDILSCIGRVQLKKLPKMTKMRNEIVRWYNEEFQTSWLGNHLYPILVKDRDKFLKYMAENGVQCSAHFDPLHKMSSYKWYSNQELPITDEIGGREVSLPLWPGLTKKQVKHICKLVKAYV